MNDNIFGKTLRKQRLIAEITLVQLAEFLNISVGYLSDVELGKRKPFKYDVIVRIANYLKNDKNELLYSLALHDGYFKFPVHSFHHDKIVMLFIKYWKDLSLDDMDRLEKFLEKMLKNNGVDYEK